MRAGPGGKTSNGGPVDGADDEGLSASHWFDAAPEGDPYSATIRFSGQRLGIHGKPGPRDSFVKDETVDDIVPGSGKVSVTTWVYGLEPGDWTVTASLIQGPKGTTRARASGGHTLPRAAWSWWRWALSAGPFNAIKTRWSPFVRLTSMPAVIHGSWPALLAAGIGVGVAVQAVLLARADLSVGLTLLVDFVAGIAGLVGAKVWFLMLRRPQGRQRSIAEGMTVDGFLLAAPLVAVLMLLVASIPIGLFLDATAPGLFIGVAIGRLGCFLTGCCAGRCTRSRWGLWSSNRRVGARRIPTQLLESAAGLVLAFATARLVLAYSPAFPGTIFVGAFASYVIVRQVLLRLRATPHSPIRTWATAVAAAVVLLADLVFSIVSSG